MIEAIDIVKEFGFPVVAYLLLYFRLEKRIDKLIAAVGQK